ncbi:MAG: hypothetical protein HY842_15935 [Bacteroidetes bacterium]|nr:hypothetical protein [Bacteroidota bacterium]
MKAIEIIARIDEKGIIRLDAPLKVANKRVKIIILFAEDEHIGDEQWLYAAASNPVFDFLNEAAEDIYTVTDGKLLKDEA